MHPSLYANVHNSPYDSNQTIDRGNKMLKPSLFACFFFFIHSARFLAVTTSTKAPGFQPTKLVDTVCHRTNSSYSFCVDSLYSDPRTPSADRYVLAYISFGLAYLNASTSRQYIAELLHKTSAAAGHSQQLQTCYNDYDKAVSALQLAYDDLNSETFSELADLAGTASLAAHDCQAVFNTTSFPLTNMNRDLEGLCKICVVVSKLFTTGMELLNLN